MEPTNNNEGENMADSARLRELRKELKNELCGFGRVIKVRRNSSLGTTYIVRLFPWK